MRIHSLWIIFLILPYTSVASKSVYYQTNAQVKPITAIDSVNRQFGDAQNVPKLESSNEDLNEQIISVRITSSVAVDRGHGKSFYQLRDENQSIPRDYGTYHSSTLNLDDTTISTDFTDSSTDSTINIEDEKVTIMPSFLEGANMEFIKQLQTKKSMRDATQFSRNVEEDNIQEESEFNSTIIIDKPKETFNRDVPMARSVPLSYSSKSYFQDSTQNTRNYKLTTVNFNIVHDLIKENSNRHNDFANPNQESEDIQTYYNEPAKVYSQPAQVYSEPAKFYSEPAKIYSEPAKIYSEPARIYSEPAKVYSEPAKFYSQPASLHLSPEVPPRSTSWVQQPGSTSINTTPITLLSSTIQSIHQKSTSDNQSEKNYEVDEQVSVMTDGQSHGVQQSNSENCKQENCKVGYVVEGRQFRKYRVEERTPDGFIVGEYGVVRNEDGALRGVRYTADSEASPRLIHDALMKFLQLK